MKSPLFWLRLLLLSSWFYVYAAYALFRSILHWGSYETLWKCNRAFSEVGLKILNLKFDIQNREKLLDDQAVVIISNHQSALDVLVLGIVLGRPYIVIGKKELKYIPFFGALLAATGSALIDRGNRKSAVEGLKTALERIRANHLGLIIFPEGTRNKRRFSLLPFKKGAFHAAKEGNLPIVRFVVGSFYSIFDRPGASLGDATIPIRVLDPLPVDVVKSLTVDELSDRCRRDMLLALDELNATLNATVKISRSFDG